MSWRVVVISSRAKLDLQLGYMVVRGERTTKVHLDEISVLLIESTEVSLTAALMAEMMERKIKVIFCDRKRNPSAELVPYYGSHDVSAKIKQQIAWSEAVKGEVGTAIIRRKIKMQAALLRSLCLETEAMLEEYAAQLQYRDATNREGHAAKVYFNSIFGAGFTRADDTTTNAALNYGYTVILAACNREITANGYLTQLGLIHDNIFNAFNLGSDIMEPLRPFVDRLVYEMLLKEELNCFENMQKYKILNVLNSYVMNCEKQVTLNYGIKVYCKSIFDALNNTDVSMIKWNSFV